MTEQDLQIPMANGLADAVLFSPDQITPWPGILHLPDIAGIRESHRSMARRLCGEGYAVLLINPFYRTRRPPVFDFQRTPGEPRTMQRTAELMAPLTPEAQFQDAATYVDFFTAQPAVLPGPIGIVGYCFSGALALRAAATRPDQVAAVASFHGVGLYKADDPASPHLLLPQIAAQLYFGHAVNDKSMDAEAIEQLDQTLATWDGIWENETYEGASHGWTVPDHPAYNAAQADRAFHKLTELFAATLR
jgi:carboxymethylenebutenolidase